MARPWVIARGCAFIGLCLTLVLGSGIPAKADSVFNVINLVTDDQSVNPAQQTDPNLVNGWGISRSGGSPFWVSANGTGTSTIYSVNGTTNATTVQGLVVTIPGAGNPTGQAFNTANAGGAFNKDLFLFVSEDGTVSGWRGALGTNAEVLQTGSPDNVYKGTALFNDTVGGHAYLLSANFRAGTIDVLKGDSGAPNLTGTFTDPNLPNGYAPFNITILNGKVYVAYAVQDSTKSDEVAGKGLGIVSVFDTQGNFLQRLSTGGNLNAPWGMEFAPSSFGTVAGDLLVGNFGDGRINVIDPTTGNQLGYLLDANGHPIVIDGLWGLIQGNGANGGSTNKIYFAAGPDDESHGLFGVIQSVPEPSSAALGLIALGVLAGSWQWKNRRRPRNP
jgi:uncharacterized protein (TIGR03118 family)